jgi:hypothetical protein
MYSTMESSLEQMGGEICNCLKAQMFESDAFQIKDLQRNPAKSEK